MNGILICEISLIITVNKTRYFLQDENSEAQEIQINISYPRRNFTAIGSYNISHSSMSSDMSLIWDKERKTLEAGLDWRRDESHPNRQEVQLQINHPSFEKVRTVVLVVASVSLTFGTNE